MPTSDASEEVSQILREWSKIDFTEAVIVIVVGLALINIIKRLIPWIADKLPDRFRFYLLPWEPILRLALIFVVAIYVAVLFIKPSPENLLAIVGATALALGFAFKDYVSSLIAGVVALYERTYRSGDWIRIEGAYGEVKSLNLRSVQILTPDDTVVMIPHGKMWDTPIYNDNRGARELMCVADFYLEPDHDGHDVQQALLDVAYTSPFTQLKRSVVVVASEKPWATHYRLKAYPIDARDQFSFITDLTLRGKTALRRLGVSHATVAAVAERDG